MAADIVHPPVPDFTAFVRARARRSAIPLLAGWGFRRRRMLRPLALAGIAAILVLATAFAASPKLRSTVAGWFGSGSTVHSPLVLGSVDFLNPRLGFVTVGNIRTHQGFLYKTTNGGKSWQPSVSFRTGGDISSLGLLGTSVTFINKDVGFVYTAYGSPTSEKPGVHIHGVLHRTVDGGKTWNSIALPTEPWQTFISLSFINRDTGWVLISSGTTMSQSTIAEFRTTNGGTSWKLQAYGGYDKNSVLVSRGGLHEGSANETIHFFSKRYGWIMGDNFTAGGSADNVTTNGGRSWHTCRSMPKSFYRVRPVPTCSGPIPPARFYRDGRKLGGSGQVFVNQLDSGNLFGDAGLLPVLENIPSSIHPYKPAPESGYYMYHLNRARTSWIRPVRLHLGLSAGSEGKVSSLNNGGLPTPAVDIESSRDWFFTNGSTIVYTTNGGRSWTHVPSPLQGKFAPGGIRFFGSGQGFVWGGSANKSGPYSPRSILAGTVDGGRIWTTIQLPTVYEGTALGFPLATKVPTGTVLLTRQQVISGFGFGSDGSSVGAALMTYGQAHARFPGLAAASSIVVNPKRKVWVLTDYLARPLSGWLGGGWTYVTKIGKFVEVAQDSAVIDAATGRETDACSGCSAVPPPRQAYSTSDGVPRALLTLFQRSVYGSEWPPSSMRRLCNPQRRPNAPADWCSERPGHPSMYFDGHVLNGWGWTPREKLRLVIDRFGHGPGARSSGPRPVARFVANARGQFALVSPRMPACGSEKLIVRSRVLIVRKAQGAVSVWAPDVCP
jgi:photosystem II stability/assembly factor-like uncharacterized protein